MSVIGIAAALAWLAQPSVRAVRRPRPEPPERPASSEAPPVAAHH
jgi:hypothetical protein